MKKASTQKVTLLIVDDKIGNIQALKAILEKPGVEILEATTGTDALQTAISNEIDLIILDVQMPGMDGFEVTQILKSNNRTKDIPVIFATAESKEHKLMMKGFEEGAHDYLFKPLNPEIVKAKVSVLLKIHLQKKELVEKNASLKNKEVLINNSADIIGIIDVATFKIEEINQAFTEILGYPAEEIKDITLPLLLSNDDRISIETLRDKQEENLFFETRVYCKNRSIKWLQWNVVSRFGKWFVNARDITEVKQVEKTKNFLAAFVKQSNDAVYIHNSEGHIITWNRGAEQIYGYNEREALRMKIWNIIPPYLLPEMQEVVTKIMEGEKIEARETKRITRNGKLIDVLFSASVIADPNDNQISIAITERDITQQKIADEQIQKLNDDLQLNLQMLQATNKELESFSYSVSHDLRAPLRAMQGNVGMIMEDFGEQLSDDIKQPLSRIQYNSERMGRIIEDLLNFSRLGRQEIKKKEIDMTALVQQVTKEIIDTTSHKANIIFSPISNANADHALMTHVWTNLISNAIKYSAKNESPQIEIGELNESDGRVYFVKDNGAGFDMKFADKLFGAFQRLHGKEYEGTGIGLAIVQRIINRHGGKIWADAKPNEGATFYFTLAG